MDARTEFVVGELRRRRRRKILRIWIVVDLVLLGFAALTVGWLGAIMPAC